MIVRLVLFLSRLQDDAAKRIEAATDPVEKARAEGRLELAREVILWVGSNPPRGKRTVEGSS